MSRQPELFSEPCVLCGSETEQTVMALVEWSEPVGKDRWTNLPRCVDRAGCRRRVEVVNGEPWPVNDRTPTPVIPPKASAPTPEPEPVASSADVEEAIPWLG